MNSKVRPLSFQGLCGVGIVLIGVAALLNVTKAQPRKASDVAGLASASGTVDAARPFTAAKVFFRNTDKRILYMVYTSGGKFQVMHLLPGNYQFSVQAKGQESEVQKIEVKGSEKLTVNATMHEVSDARAANGVQMLTYDEIYPPASAGRKIAERLCIRCHGPNFIPSRQWEADQWNSSIDFMMGNGNPRGAQIQPEELSDADRQILVNWLVQNFGPDSKPRAVKFQKEMPVEEARIAKAEYIEYYLKPDPPGEGRHSPEYSGVRSPFGDRRVSQDVVFDNKGYVWVTDRGIPNRIARLDPKTGEYLDFLTPRPKVGIHDLMIDNQGVLYVPEEDGLNMEVFDTKTMKWLEPYALDPDKVIPGMKNGQSLVIDSKHNIYANFIVGNGMSRLDWRTKKVTVTSLPTPNSFPYGVVKDKYDNVWIAEFHGSKIAKLDAETQKYTEYAPPTTPALIRRLTVDSKDNVWFGLFSVGKLERLDPRSGNVTEWDIPFENSQPYDEKESINKGKIWFSDAGQGGALILFDPATKQFTIYPGPQRSDMPMIRVANDGAVWYAPRSGKNGGVGVLYPDMTKVTSLAGYGNND
jgi:streptogramin lyase